MSKKNYNVQFSLGNEKKTAKAIAANAPVSLKYSTEIAREIKGKRLEWAVSFLQDIALKKAPAFKALHQRSASQERKCDKPFKNRKVSKTLRPEMDGTFKTGKGKRRL